MKTHAIDKETKDIVKAIIHGENRRKARKQKGQQTSFDRTIDAAIKTAKKELTTALAKEMELDPCRKLVDSIYKSLLYNTPWELAGETYICRRLYYNYRTELCYLIAVNLDLISRPGAAVRSLTGQNRPGK